MMLLLSAADGVGMEILKIGDIVPCGGDNSGVISVVVLLCLKKCANIIRYTVICTRHVLIYNDHKIKVELPAMLAHCQ